MARPSPSPPSTDTSALGIGEAAYDAFISYSQRGDKAVAQALRTLIQTIGKPWWQVRSLHVFLDATSLSAAPNLWQGIEEKLDRSRYLILLASPEAAASKWVDREVAHFVERFGLDHVLIALTDGDLVWDDATRDFSAEDGPPPLPPSLRGAYADEPLWVDLRAFRADPSAATRGNQAFLLAALDLAATIKGAEKADLYSEEVRRQRRSVRVAYGISTVVAGLAVAAGIAAWIAVQNAERATAEAEKAVRNFDIAKSTVDQVILDIAQGLREVEGMRVENVRTILSRVEAAVGRLTEAAADDVDVQNSRAMMLEEFGETYASAGDIASAMAAYEEYLSIVRELSEGDPDNGTLQRTVGVALSRIGEMKMALGDLGGALTAFDGFLANARALAAANPVAAELQRDVAVALDNIGEVKLLTGDAAGALAAHEEAIAIHRRLAEADPGNREWQRRIAVEREKAGNARLALGDTAGALRDYEEALAITRVLAEAEPGNTQLQRDMSVDLGKIGTIRLEGDDVAGAIAVFEEALAINRRLAELDPGNIVWRRDLSVALGHTGAAMTRTGDAAAALAAYRQGLAISRDLAEIDPENSEVRRDIASGLALIGDLLRDSGDSDEALSAYEESLDIARGLAARDPSNTAWQRDVAVALDRVGRERAARGDTAGAQAAFEESFAIARKLTALDPGNALWQMDVAVGLERIGIQRHTAGDLDGALTAYAEGLDIYRQLSEATPDRTTVQQGIARMLGLIGDVKRDTSGGGQEALSTYEESLAIYRRLAGVAPENPARHRDLIAALERTGFLKARAGDQDGAVKVLEEIITVRRTIVALLPNDPEAARHLADDLERLGQLRTVGGNTTATLTAFEEALAIRRDIVATDPDSLDRQTELLVSLRRIGELRLDAGDANGGLAAFTEGLAVARRLAAADPRKRTDVVVSLADIQSVTEDPEVRRDLLDEALGLLGELQSDGALTADQEGWIAWAQGVRAEVLGLVGKKKLAAGDPAGALAAYDEGLAAYRALAAAEPDNNTLQQALSALLGKVAFARLFAGQYSESETASREAIALDPDGTWLETNLAHALMLQDRLAEADRIYLDNRGVTFGDRLWEDVVLGDFEALRAAGVSHIHMAEIERIFAGETEDGAGTDDGRKTGQ